MCHDVITTSRQLSWAPGSKYSVARAWASEEPLSRARRSRASPSHHSYHFLFKFKLHQFDIKPDFRHSRPAALGLPDHLSKIFWQLQELAEHRSTQRTGFHFASLALQGLARAPLKSSSCNSGPAMLMTASNASLGLIAIDARRSFHFVPEWLCLPILRHIIRQALDTKQSMSSSSLTRQLIVI